MAFNWTCPHCDAKTTINKDDYSTDDSMLHIKNADKTKYLRVDWIVCPNTSCKKSHCMLLCVNTISYLIFSKRSIY